MLCSRISLSVLLTLLLTAFSALTGTVAAAPQILALVASNGVATPLSCDDGICQAELSSFCLQQSRPTPVAGTVYHAVAPNDLTLVIEQADGTRRHVPAGDHLKLTAARGSTSVRASLVEISIAGYNAVKLSLLVADQVSLLPEPVQGDVNPLRDQEIAVTTAGLRKLGTRVVDEGGTRIAAARETNRLINSLPAVGNSGRPDAAWDKITAWKPSIRSGNYWANQLISHCEAKPMGPALRQCLRDWHDFLMRQMNTKYWDAVRAGS